MIFIALTHETTYICHFGSFRNLHTRFTTVVSTLGRDCREWPQLTAYDEFMLLNTVDQVDVFTDGSVR